MPLEPPRTFATQRDWDKWARAVGITPDDGTVTTAKIKDESVTSAKLRNSAAASVMGRSAALAGQPGDISSGADNQLLVRRSGTLGFGVLVDADIPGSITRDTELTAAVAVIAPLIGTATYDPPSLAAGSTTSTTVTVTGATLGMGVVLSFSLDLQGIELYGNVSAANTVTAWMKNQTGGTLDLASGTLKARCYP